MKILSKSEMVELEAFVELTRNGPQSFKILVLIAFDETSEYSF